MASKKWAEDVVAACVAIVRFQNREEKHISFPNKEDAGRWVLERHDVVAWRLEPLVSPDEVDTPLLKVGDKLDVVLFNGLGQRMEYPGSVVVAIFMEGTNERCVVELITTRLSDPFYGEYKVFYSERAAAWKQK